MVRGFLKHSFKGVVAPFAAATVAGNAAAQVSHLLTNGEFLSSFMNASNMEQGVAVVSSMVAAGLTGYALANWKMKPLINIPS